MKIKNVKVYGLEEAILRSKYPMEIGEPKELTESYIRNNLFNLSTVSKRATALAKNPPGSGHPNWLIGVNVQFDLCYPQYWTKHLQRYHWFQYFSGQSIMHKLTQVPDIRVNCNQWVLCKTVTIVNELIEVYNITKKYPIQIKDENHNGFFVLTVNSKKDLFHYIVSNCPMGYELWVPVSTNYLQLKTIYMQRHTDHEHKLYDWKEFCAWIETLPMSHLITGKESNE